MSGSGPQRCGWGTRPRRGGRFRSIAAELLLRSAFLVVVVGLAGPVRGGLIEYPDHSDLLVVRGEAGELQPIESRAGWERRRRHILAGMERAMGALPDRTDLPPLDVRVAAREQREGFEQVELSFLAEPGDRIPAYLLLPDGLEAGEARPAMLALHPTHPAGKGDTAGLTGRRNRGYGAELARRGYVVLVPDYPSFGDYEPYPFELDRYASGSMKGIFNHMRAVDLLRGRDEVAPERIGVIGHSLGGHNAMFVGAFDTRLKVVVSSCGWTPFHDYYGGDIEGWTSDRYMPRLREVYGLDPDRVPFDFYEVVAALAPRRFFSVSPQRDHNFAVAGVRKAEAEARKVYELLGVGDRLQVIYPDAEHDFPPGSRRKAYRFIDRVLGHTPERDGLGD